MTNANQILDDSPPESNLIVSERLIAILKKIHTLSIWILIVWGITLLQSLWTVLPLFLHSTVSDMSNIFISFAIFAAAFIYFLRSFLALRLFLNDMTNRTYFLFRNMLNSFLITIALGQILKCLNFLYRFFYLQIMY